MNPDFVIGTRNPGVIMERYLNDVRDNDRVAYPKNEEETETVSATESTDTVNMAAIEVRPDDAKRPENTDHVESTASATGRRERGRGPEAMEGDLSFEDVLDILNPLQHLPIISHIYRAISGDKIRGFAEVAGSALFGGPLGIITGAFNAMFEDETGKPAVQTMVANLFGFGDDKKLPTPEEATLETQLAEAEHNIVTDEDGPTQVQLASASKIPKTLDAQIAGAMLPPVPPMPPSQMAGAKAPFGGIMDMSTIKAGQAAATANREAPRASPLPGTAASGYNATPHPPVEENGQKFYSLAGVRRVGENAPSMPIHTGPDVRLKPLSRQSVSGVIMPTQTITATPRIADPEAAKALGLSTDVEPMAELGRPPIGSMLSGGDVDLHPAYGQGSQAVPPALIEDMMRMGLDKYQKGLESGTLGPRSNVDIRG